jgi:hypothetical protein
MKFSSRLLKTAGTVVYVLFESDRLITEKNPGNPIGVVSSEHTASLFYQRDSKRRNFFQFNLDELPEETGIPGNLTPPPLPSVEEVDATRKRVEDRTQEMQRFLEEMKMKRKKR